MTIVLDLNTIILYFVSFKKVPWKGLQINQGVYTIMTIIYDDWVARRKQRIYIIQTELPGSNKMVYYFIR